MKSREERFSNFCADLEAISRKHNVSIYSCGGVEIHDTPLLEVHYINDPTSGDLDVVTVEEG